MFLVRLYLSGSGLDIFVVSGGIRGINMFYVWKENMIDVPIKKSVFLPNSQNMCSGPEFLFISFYFNYHLFV